MRKYLNLRETLLKCLLYTACLSICMISNGQNIKISFIDCSDDSNLEDCFIYNNSHELLGITDEKGIVNIYSERLNAFEHLVVTKIGYDSEVILIDSLEEIFCLNSIKLRPNGEIIISAFKDDPQKHFLKYLNKSIESIKGLPEYTNYEFNYRLIDITSGMSENLCGNIYIPSSIYYQNKYPSIYYENIKYEADTLFTNSQAYESLPGNRISQNIRKLYLSKAGNFDREVRRADDVKRISTSDTSLVCFSMTSSNKRKIRSHTIFDRSDSLLVSNEFFTPSGGFKIGNNKLNFFYSYEVYSNNNPLHVKDLNFIEEYVGVDGVKIRIEFEMSFSEHINTNLSQITDSFKKVDMRHTKSLIRSCDEVILK